MSVRSRLSAFTLALALLPAAASAQASGPPPTSLLLVVPGLEGESPQEPGAIEVMSYSWGLSATRSAAGGGLGAGKTSFTDLQIVKPTDKSSPKLMQACASGQHFPSAVLVARKAGRGREEYLKVELKEVLVTSYQTGGGASGAAPTESVSLTFGQVVLEYREQRPDGSLGAPVVSCWDVRANRSCTP